MADDDVPPRQPRAIDDLAEVDALTTRLVHDQMPLTALLGFDVLSSAPERVVMRGRWAPARCTAAGLLHGGYLMALADSAGALCASLNLPPGAGTSTIESKTNFFRAVKAGEVRATSTPVHVGGTTIVVQTDVVRDDGALVVRTTQTQAVLAPRAS